VCVCVCGCGGGRSSAGSSFIIFSFSLYRIFSFLDVVSLCRCAQVSKVHNYFKSAGLTFPFILQLFFRVSISILTKDCRFSSRIQVCCLTIISTRRLNMLIWNTHSISQWSIEQGTGALYEPTNCELQLLSVLWTNCKLYQLVLSLRIFRARKFSHK